MFFQLVCAFLLAFVLLFSPSPAQAGSMAVKYLDLTGKDYSSQSLLEAEFSHCTLDMTDFSNADLRGAVISQSKMNRANMHGADFSLGIAYLVDFVDTDLSDALFVESELLRSTFKKVDITGADFTYAILERAEQKKLCAIADGVNSKTGVSTRESLGCR